MSWIIIKLVMIIILHVWLLLRLLFYSVLIIIIIKLVLIQKHSLFKFWIFIILITLVLIQKLVILLNNNNYYYSCGADSKFKIRFILGHSKLGSF